MDCRAATQEAVRLVWRAACSEELEAVVGSEKASILEQYANQAIELLDEQALPLAQAARAICDLTRECVYLASQQPCSAITQDEGWGDCDILWVSGPVVAEVMANGLAASANLLAVVRCWDTGGMETERETVLDMLRDVSLDIDCLSLYLYSSLCRFDVSAGTSRPKGSAVIVADETRRLELGLRTICVWTLVTLGRAVGYDRLDTMVLWEWAHADALWAFTLLKGVIAFRAASLYESDELRVLVPLDLPLLYNSMIEATLGLADPSVAFETWREDSSLADNDISIVTREISLARHRAHLAAAAVECGLAETLIWEVLQAECPNWLLALATFLTAILRPIKPGLADDPTAWRIQPDDDGTELGLDEARLAAAKLSAQLRPHADRIWIVLASVRMSSDRRSYNFLHDCAVIAHAVPPSREQCCAFLDTCLTGENPYFMRSDIRALAELCVLAANAGLEPIAGLCLTEALGTLFPEDRESMAKHLASWRGSVQAAALAQWSGLLDDEPGSPGIVSPSWHVADASNAVCEAVESNIPVQRAQPQLSVAPTPHVNLRSLVNGAPPEFRCALDGKLLMDPVRSPQGYVFERSVLAAALNQAIQQSICPLTASPLTLEECVRVPELRVRISKWVRQVKPGPQHAKS